MAPACGIAIPSVTTALAIAIATVLRENLLRVFAIVMAETSKEEVNRTLLCLFARTAGRKVSQKLSVTIHS